AGALALGVRRADRLRGILDDLQSVASRALHEWRHVGHLPVQVHGHEGTHPRATAAMQLLAAAPLAVLLEEALERRGAEIKGHRIDVTEERPRADPRDGSGGGEEGEGTRDHRIARPDP